ncbi:MAG: aspartate/glutamate racemase family protein [Anaerolineales bacterium]|nr:aspartate/glutamate racemase family protein [Anaerolineales bacterium]
MKTIGLLGGMSWESTAEYYRILNQAVKERLGGVHSARCVLVSVDFAEHEAMLREARWEDLEQALIADARLVEAGGADFLLICTNTMHKMAEKVQAGIHIPLLHIADSAAGAIKAHGLKTVGLLGTRFTMEQDFFRGRLTEKFGLQVVIPDEADREIVHRVIFDELVVGEIKGASRTEFVRIIERTAANGAEGIILGCTEIGSLVKQADSPVPLFDTTELHALAAVEMALD